MTHGLPLLRHTALAAPHAAWTIIFDDDYTPVWPALADWLATRVALPGARLEYETIAGVPLLCGFFPAEHCVRVASPNAARELALLDGVAHDDAVREIIFADTESVARYNALTAHMQALTTLAAAPTSSVWQQITAQHGLPDLVYDTAWAPLHQATARLAKKLAVRLHAYRPGALERLSDWLLQLTSAHALLRVHLLKLIAVLPSIDHDTRGVEVKRLTHETLRRMRDDSRQSTQPLPRWMHALTVLAMWKLACIPARTAAWAIRGGVRFFATRFIAGESIETATASLSALFATARDVTLDQLGELVVSEPEAENYCHAVLRLIDGFAQHIPAGARNRAGILRAHISIKLSALTPEFKPHAREATYDKVAPRLLRILRAAQSHQVFINIDAEHYPVRDLSWYILRRVLRDTPELATCADVGIVVQAYLRDAHSHLQEIIAFARERGVRMPVRLVKGAYWDAETIDAEAHNFIAPQFLNKCETDLHFRQLILAILAAPDALQLCLASHNLHDHCFAEAAHAEKYSTAPTIEHECLHGTYEALSAGMAQYGWAVRNYIPIGSLLVGMAYLVRRIMENSSQVGVLTIMRTHKNLAAVTAPEAVLRAQLQAHALRTDPALQPDAGFRNITPSRLYRRREWENMDAAMANRALGSITFATPEFANAAILRATTESATGRWPRLPAVLRAAILQRAATLMLVERLALAAVMVHEAGKDPSEALNEVDEAIDFLNFYSRVEVDYARTHHVIARGVTAVIAPWNFPLALACGMISAPLAAGNTVLLKSAERTPHIAQRCVDILHRAGVPADALQHLPGEGRVIGRVLVDHENISTIVFTGSKTVGLSIASRAGRRLCHPPARPQLAVPTKIITEMGGKNAIVITGNADLDETIAGALYSCFAHAGQKCSAASRLIVDAGILERFVQRFALACRDLSIGAATDWSVSTTPLIAAEEQTRLRERAQQMIAEAAQHGGRVIIDRSAEKLPGFCLGPIVVQLPAARAVQPESLAMQELFGPLIHIIPYHSLEEAVTIANATEYALTSGIFSQSQDDIDYLLARLQAGNLYVNRSITGARVAIEPFGGFKHSGTGPKAGSRHYLESFHLPDEPVAGAPDKSRETVQSFTQWLTQHASAFQRTAHPNRAIPGQRSYDDHTLARQHVLILAAHAIPSTPALMYVHAAQAVGARITIVAETESLQATWKNITDRWDTPPLICSALPHPLPDDGLIFIDAAAPDTAALLAQLYTAAGTNTLLNIHTPWDGPATNDWNEFLQPMVFVRSCAINTMRYGAPLVVNDM